MKSERLQSLQTGMSFAVLLYLLFLLCMFGISAGSNPKWSKWKAEGKNNYAPTMQELQTDFRDTTRNLEWGLNLKNKLLLTYFIASIGMICFLGWSLFMIWRLKKEEPIDQAKSDFRT